MKKTISVIAALSVFISVLSFATVSVTANDTAGQPSNKEYELLTKIDFESGQQSQFYSDTKNKLSGKVELKENAVHYTRIEGINWNWTNKMLLSNNAGTDSLNTRTRDTVKISVDIKADSINDYLDQIKVGIAYITQGDADVLTSNAGKGWVTVEKREDIITIKKSDLSTSEWKTFIGEFTVPSHNKDELPFIYLYSVETEENKDHFWDNKIWLDNIVVERLISDNEVSVVDFDSEKQPAFYGDTTNNLGGRMELLKSNDSKYGSVIRYTAAGQITWECANKILLSDNAGANPLNTRWHDTVKISVDIKADFIHDELTKIIFGIAYTTQDNANWLSTADGKNGWANVEKRKDIITINKSDLSTSEWKTFIGEFTVPFHNKGELPFIYMYAPDSGDNGWQTRLFLDNIVIEQPKTEKSGFIDFDINEQSNFYSMDKKDDEWVNIQPDNGELISLTDEDDAAHGNVYQVKTAVRGDLKITSNDDAYKVGKAAAICLGNTMGTARLHPETGEEIFVTAEVKNKVSSDAEIYIAVVFDEQPGRDVGEWNKGLLDPNVHVCELGQIDMKNTDWQRVGKKFTVPEINASTETPKLVVYTKNGGPVKDLQIYIDNIFVEEVSNINGDVNRDNETDIRDLIALNKRAVSNQYDVFADVSFDGKLNETDCSLLRHLLLNR